MALPLETLRRQIADDLLVAHPDDAAHFRRVAVEPELVPIAGDPRHERVWVVARAGDEALSMTMLKVDSTCHQSLMGCSRSLATRKIRWAARFTLGPPYPVVSSN
jgi:hypothetical protein